MNTRTRLGARRAAVTICGGDVAKLEIAEAAIKQAGSPEVIAKILDLYDHDGVDAFPQEIESDRPLDYLVNTVSYFSPISSLEHARKLPSIP